MTNLQKQRIAVLRKSGDNYAAIAEALGISIKSHCRRNGLCADYIKEQPIATDVCANCDYPLAQTPGAKKKRFCSDKCRLSWWAAHPESVNRKAVYRFVCPVCETVFTAYGNAKRKYCRHACASAARKSCHE